jgi:hypothetical protein
MLFDDFPDAESEQRPHPWIVLKTTYDVEAWIDQASRRLQRLIADGNADGNPNSHYRNDGQGICFGLEHGGEVYTHTTQEGELLLDVTEDAAWVRPVIAAVAGTDAPPGAIWRLPGECLTELLCGLSGLISTTRLVLQHDFRIKKRY